MRIFIITILLMFCGFLEAQVSALLYIDENFKEVNASSFVSNFGDVKCEMSIEDILNEWNYGSFTNLRKKSNIGFTQVCYWMEFQLINDTEEEKDLLVEIPNPDLEGISFFVFNEDQQLIKSLKTGSKFPFIQREVHNRNFLFKLKAEPQQIYAIFIRIDQQPNFVNVPIKVWNEASKIDTDQNQVYRFGLFCGIMLLYLFVMTIVSYFLQDKYYLYYTFLLGLGFLFIFVNEGFAFQYFYPDHPWLRNVTRYSVLNTYMLVSILFLENFIRDKLRSKLVFRLLEGGMIFLVLLTLVIIFYPRVSLLLQFRISITLSIIVILLNLFIFILLVILYIRTKQLNLIYLIAAYSIAILVILFFTLIKFGLLPINIDTSGAIYIGIAIVGVIFTILFSFRILDVIENNKKLRKELSVVGIRSTFALLEGQEKERKRVADELHDDIGIKMSALKMKLSTLSFANNNKKIEEIIQLVDHSCVNIRTLSHSLVPRNIERYGLAVAIHDLIEELSRDSKTIINFRQKRLAENIDQVSKLAIYRLLEGLLTELVRRKVEQVKFNLVIIPSIKQVSIDLNYVGRRVEFGVNINLANVRAIIQVLNGQVRWNMDTMWANQIYIEIPVVANQEEEPVNF